VWIFAAEVAMGSRNLKEGARRIRTVGRLEALDSEEEAKLRRG